MVFADAATRAQSILVRQQTGGGGAGFSSRVVALVAMRLVE